VKHASYAATRDALAKECRSFKPDLQWGWGMLGWGKEFCGDGHRLKQIEKGIEQG